MFLVSHILSEIPFIVIGAGLGYFQGEESSKILSTVIYPRKTRKITKKTNLNAELAEDKKLPEARKRLKN